METPQHPHLTNDPSPIPKGENIRAAARMLIEWMETTRTNAAIDKRLASQVAENIPSER